LNIFFTHKQNEMSGANCSEEKHHESYHELFLPSDHIIGIQSLIYNNVNKKYKK